MSSLHRLLPASLTLLLPAVTPAQDWRVSNGYLVYRFRRAWGNGPTAVVPDPMTGNQVQSPSTRTAFPTTMAWFAG